MNLNAHVLPSMGARSPAIAAVGALAIGIFSIVGNPMTADATTTTQTFTSDGTFIVPTGVASLTVTVIGAGGAASRGKDSSLDPSAVPPPGGAGASVSATVTVTPGAALTIDVGQAGQHGVATVSGPDDGGEGGAGFGSGAKGGDSDWPNVPGAGGGGGASAISDGASVLVVAGAGGGAGGPNVSGGGSSSSDSYSNICEGLDAIDPVTPPSYCMHLAAPTGHDGGEGAVGYGWSYGSNFPGGGGGGGWVGGAGGSAVGQVEGMRGGGGVGGSSFADATRTSAVAMAGASNPGENGSVTITFDEPDPTTTSSSTTLAPTTTTTIAPATTEQATTIAPATTRPSRATMSTVVTSPAAGARRPAALPQVAVPAAPIVTTPEFTG